MTDALTPRCLRRASAAAAALALLASGCGMLRASPGDEFQVLLFSTPDAVGRIEVPLQFGVRGCPSFTAEVEGALGRHAIDFVPDVDGTWRANVPVEWLRGEDGTCLHDAASPLRSKATLLVTCVDAGRTATAELDVRYATASRAYELGGVGAYGADLAYVYPGADPAAPLVIALPAYGRDAVLNVGPRAVWPSLAIDPVAFESSTLLRPRAVAAGSAVFATAGCASGTTCPALVGPGGDQLPSEKLASYPLDGVGGASGAGTWVPARVIDVALTSAGVLVVLSQAGLAGVQDATPLVTTVTRVDPGAERGEEIGHFPGEWAQTRFSHTAGGDLAFLTYQVPALEGPLVPVLRTTDGATVTARMNVTGDLSAGYARFCPEAPPCTGDTCTGCLGSMLVNTVQLSPDASTIVLLGWMGTPDSAYVPLPASGYYGDGEDGPAIWLPGALALWRPTRDASPLGPAESGQVEVFDPAPPYASRARYEVQAEPGTSGRAYLRGAIAVGDKLVLTTSTGVRVLSSDGRVIGGADPLPCRLGPISKAAQTGPHHVAVAAGSNVYVFDLSAMEPVPPGP